MNQDYVSYELAVKLKAAGFNEPCDCYYDCHHNLRRYAETDQINRNTNGHHTPSMSAPTFWQVAKWLPEAKGIYLDLNLYGNYFGDIDCTPNNIRQYWAFDILSAKSGDVIVEGHGKYRNYNTALSVAIGIALNLIGSNN